LSRLLILVIAILAAETDLAAQRRLAPRLEGSQIRVTAPQLHFLKGEPLDRLMNGASVTFEFRLIIREGPSGATLSNARQRFVMSYDLWEERFAITKLDNAPRSVSHLTAVAAEAWCLENVSVAADRLTDNRVFWLRLEFHAENPLDSAQQSENSGITLSGLVDIFSRRGQDEQPRGYEEDGPFRLSDLRKTKSR
jgi:hypothetical protein